MPRALSSRLICGLVFCLATGFGSTVTRANLPEANFSRSLSPAQFQASGLEKLSRDQLDVLDAEVQRDSSDAALATSAVSFSARRAPVQRSRDGLALLNREEISQLDELVAQRFSSSVALTTANPGAIPIVRHDAADAALDPWETGPRLAEIHGSVSLTFGTGKGGSFYGGDFQAVYLDPAHRFTVGFGYSEYHGKGLPCAFGLNGLEGIGADRFTGAR